MTEPRLAETSSRAARIQDALNNIGSWLLDVVSVDPGWSEMVLDVKPLAGQIFVRVREFRDGEEFIGTIGPLKDGSPIIAEVRKLQRAAYDGNRGTWFTASIVVAATGWPNPQFSVGASYNRDDEPASWKNEGTLTATDVREHLTEFPRDASRIPAWARERMEGRARHSAAAALSSSEHEIPNPYLVAALETFRNDVQERTLINVVRTMLGGDVLLDATGSLLIPSETDPMGPESVLIHQVIRMPETGMQALCVFSSSEHIGKSYVRQESEGDELILREPAMKVFIDFLGNEALDLIVVDPGTDHECYIERAQVHWIVTSPRNDGAKMALTQDNMQMLLGSLVSPASVLLVGVDPADPSGTSFVFDPDENGNPQSLLVFTSPIEIAALDPHIEVRSANALDILRYALEIGAPSVKVNAINPSTVLTAAQIRELLEIVGSQPRMGA